MSDTKKTPEKKAEKKSESAAPAPRRFAVDRLMTVVLAPVPSASSRTIRWRTSSSE